MSSSPLQSALQSAPERASVAASRPEQELFCFEVGGLRLSFAAKNVREVVRVAPLTPLPRTPAFLLGVSGHRGEVLPVVDLLRFLGKGEAKPSVRSRLLIGISGSYVVSFIADHVDGLKKVDVADIQPAPLGSDAAAEYLDGVVQRHGAVDPLHLLNLPRLANAIRQRVVTR